MKIMVAGNATGNHSHVEVAKGKWQRYSQSGYCMVLNSQGVWNLPNSVSPDKAFVIDGVTVYNNGNPTASGNKMNWIKADSIPGITKKVTVPSKAYAVYRLYREETGEHFFTGSQPEAQKLVDNGRIYEGVAWMQPVSGSSVYRLYNPKSTMHILTTSDKERTNLKNAGWTDEGPMLTGADSGTAVYRLYNKNNGDHLYTTSTTERDNLKKAGWSYEGVAFYGA